MTKKSAAATTYKHRFLPLKIGLVTILLAMFGAESTLHATQTNNHGLRAVPVLSNGAPKIDGDLSDWDLSGQIFACYDIETLKDVYSVRVSAMYDADNFYIALQWKDPIPMGNSHDPRYQAARGWAGDSVQLRFKTDRISHLTAWYYAPRNEPAMTISYGKSMTEPFGGGDTQLYPENGSKMQKGVEMAFKKDADGKGYTQEIKIPWTLITTNKKYKAGDRFSLGFEFLWGEADWPVHRYADNLAEGTTSREFFWTAHTNWGPVYLEPKGNLPLPPAAASAIDAADINDADALTASAENGPIEIEYTLPKDARVTLAIENKDGTRIRNLVPALPRQKGKNVEHWDGLDDNAKPVSPGDYTFKALMHDGISVTYALSFANPGKPSWPTADGKGAFYADHSAPQAVATSPKGNIVALACPVGEAGNHLIACTLDGQRLWGLNNRAAFDGGRISLATDGTTLWVASEGKKSIIYRVELATGRYSPWDSTQKTTDGTTFKLLDLSVSELPGISAPNSGGANLTAIALSPKANALAASFARENLVRLYNPTTGEVLSQLTVPSPQAITYTPDGDLIILSENKLLHSRKGTETPVLFSTQNFENARALASDRDGNIYIAVRGNDQNIKVLAPDGTPRAKAPEIGTRGGRPANGPYNPNALRSPAALGIDARGQLWIAEETMNPKRTSVWNATTGKLVRDLSGTTGYASAGSLNPYDLTMGFNDNTVYRLDWKTNTYTPTYSLARRASETDSASPELFPPSVHNLTSRTVMSEGRLYAFTTDSARGSGDVQCTLYDGQNWRSVAHVGVVRSYDKKGPAAKYTHPFFAGHENQLYTWADENGDGLVQENELHFSQLQIDAKRADPRSYYWGQLPGPDGTITFMVRGNKNTLIQFPIAAINKAGAPIYKIDKPHIIRTDRPLVGIGESGEGMLMGGTGGRVFINQDPLIAVERDGHVSGGYPNRNVSVHGSHHAAAARSGYLIGPSSILGTASIGDPAKGEAGEVFILNGNLGENYLFTQDALYIQTLFRDTRGVSYAPPVATPGIPMDDITAGGESFGGNFIRTPDGHTYLTLGSTDARVLEVHGLENIRRFSGKFTYTKEQYAASQKLLSQKIAAAQAPKTITITRTTTAPTIDGKLDDWSSKFATIDIQETPRQRTARVQAAYDNDNLYLAYQVTSRRKAPRNTGQDDRLLFKTGDSVDIMIAPAEATVTGLRIIMTQKDGKLIAVLNQKNAPSASPAEKYDFSSPWRTITFARVATITPNMRLATATIQGGYTIEAAIPWSVLGITPTSGQRLRIDFGVLTGDASSQTTSRQYWSNKSTALVNDIPGEADLTPALWGTATLE